MNAISIQSSTFSPIPEGILVSVAWVQISTWHLLMTFSLSCFNIHFSPLHFFSFSCFPLLLLLLSHSFLAISLFKNIAQFYPRVLVFVPIRKACGDKTNFKKSC